MKEAGKGTRRREGGEKSEGSGRMPCASLLLFPPPPRARRTGAGGSSVCLRQHARFPKGNRAGRYMHPFAAMISSLDRVCASLVVQGHHKFPPVT